MLNTTDSGLQNWIQSIDTTLILSLKLEPTTTTTYTSCKNSHTTMSRSIYPSSETGVPKGIPSSSSFHTHDLHSNGIQNITSGNMRTTVRTVLASIALVRSAHSLAVTTASHCSLNQLMSLSWRTHIWVRKGMHQDKGGHVIEWRDGGFCDLMHAKQRPRRGTGWMN